jgi:zinc protease
VTIKVKQNMTENSDNLNLFFEEFVLDNGLHCILHHDNRNPLVNVTVGYDVGSRSEKPNKRGIAHLFEHLMFQGSDNVKKNEYFQHVLNAGGTANAFTTFDATVYFETVPAHYLDLALWLESDRMNSLQLTEENLANQKSVVIEEKLQRYDNAPYGTAFMNILKNIFEGSNYEWSVIGEIEDINSFTLNEAIEFHNKFYSPDNAVLIISGDFDREKIKEKINKYFANIRSSKTNGIVSNGKFNVPEMKSDRELLFYDNITLPAIYLAYQSPSAGTKDDYSLEYFSDLIANKKSSRLYRKFVYEEKKLQSINVIKYPLKYSGIYFIKAMLFPGVDINKMKEEITYEIEKAISDGIKDNEFESIRNNLEFKNLLQFQTIQNIGVETVFNWIYYNDVNRINEELKRYKEISKEDVIDSSNKYLLQNSKAILKYVPKK